MPIRSFRSTTSTALVLALAVPAPVLGQDADLPRCNQATEAPCVTARGEVLDELPQRRQRQLEAEASAEAKAGDSPPDGGAAAAGEAGGAAVDGAPASDAPAGNEAATVQEQPEQITDTSESTEPEPAATADAPVQELPAAAAASAEEAPAAEVEVQEVTEETARSASEEFETAVSTEGQAAAETQGSGGGLSNFEKALIVGLGAVAVGSILKNGSEVVSNSGDRVVVRDQSGDLRVLKNDDALLNQPGSEVRTETFNDGSTRTTVTRPNGSRIVTIKSAGGEVLRRTRIRPDGTEVVIFDETDSAPVEPVDVSTLPQVEEAPRIDLRGDDAALRNALARQGVAGLDRRFSLRQIRDIPEVRRLAPQIDVDNVTFNTGSAAIQPDQAQELAALGRAMVAMIDANPREVFLVEGHTDAVGDASYNLALSDRRAETVALALSEYFGVPPENMIVQGYGESALRIPTLEPERLNRRAVVRRITPLLREVVARN